MKDWIKYAAAIVVGATIIADAYFLPVETFLAFVIGWLFLIPATFVVYMLVGLRKYMEERKRRIVVSIKPSEAMKTLARREAELKREKERLYEELQKK